MPNASNPPSRLDGLSVAEAGARLARDGYNELPRSARRTPFRIVLEVIREPMLALLIGGGAVYLLLGDLTEAVILIAFAGLSVVITVVQETRTERVLDALRDLTSPRALVIRDGERQRIAGREVVRGDLIVLGEGDRVPADAQFIEGQDLQADESLLTGESVPVRKAPDPTLSPQRQRPGGDDLPTAFSGTLIVRGAGIAEVVATGATSEIGRIGKTLGTLDTAAPHLQTQTRRIVGIFALVGGAISALVVVLYGTLRGGWLDAVLAGIAVGMSMLPEEFPVVLTVFMAMGAWRISQVRVLTRRATAIETLGSATVLCTDKTGTLTENRMTISELRLTDGASCVVDAGKPLAEPFRELVRSGVKASAVQPFDPMEKAFHIVAASNAQATTAADGRLVRTYALRPDLLAMSNVWQPAADGALLVAAKGAPEAVADLCRLAPAQREAVTTAVDQMAAAGLRVLGVARASFTGSALPDAQPDFDFEFAGLVGLADPLRPSVPAAVAECRSAGIRVIMITGDYPATAREVARQAGLGDSDPISGDELETLSDAELIVRIRTTSVFARIMPEQKLRIVQALKADGEIVAMTGDGVNDAPSLKAAHIGVAMGGRGTDVAREASSIVLLDDDFGSIVTTVRLGRRIFDNLRKAMSFIFAVHVPIAGLALLPLIFGLPILFGPMHIAFLEMVIDPVCSLVFEAETEEDDLMRRPPRDPAEPLFSMSMILWSLLQGVLAFAVVAAIFVIALQRGMPENEVRALTFFSLVISIVALIILNRSASTSLLKAIRRPNRALALVVCGVAAMLALTLLWPFARHLFRFGPLHADDITLTIGAGIVILVVLELLKPLWRRIFSAAARNSPIAPQPL
ncbi:cation-translocating P-type ATPase [Rhodopseudomonas sp. P2A-2r]|uniref:cation-translocating P-type ATPase n=1 Tax=unclassified Rhodopseudomonas TaxID=2638247 RepID=UPI002233F97D|nr:cation-translocating P-type ATPase [Rhodopseudomonas sp. P2A-2r]UZE47332.1 cation-translocating P-type ATPase [Rhodopseudomonas sp. P2A-2r]